MAAVISDKIKLTVIKMYNDEQPYANIRKKCNVSTSSITSILKEHGVGGRDPWNSITDDDIHYINIKRAEGKTLSEIGKKLGISKSAVSRRLSRHNQIDKLSLNLIDLDHILDISLLIKDIDTPPSSLFLDGLKQELELNGKNINDIKHIEITIK